MTTNEIDLSINLDNGHSLFARQIVFTSESSNIGNVESNNDDSSNDKKNEAVTAKQQRSHQTSKDPIDTSSSSNQYMIIVVHGGSGLADHTEIYSGLRNLLLREEDVVVDNDVTKTNTMMFTGRRTHSSNNSNIKCSNNRHHRMIHGMLFYDQLGCGKSDKPSMIKQQQISPLLTSKNDNVEATSTATTKMNKTRSNHNVIIPLYSLEYYVNELEQVIAYVQKRHPTKLICLLGHSWGGQLVLEWSFLYNINNNHDTNNNTTTYKNLVKKIIISNAPLDERTYEEKQKQLRHALDAEIQLYYEQEEEQLKIENSIGYQIFYQLIGQSDLQITGSMKDWSILDRIKTKSIIFNMIKNNDNNSNSKTNKSSYNNQRSIQCLFICSDDDTVPHEEYIDLTNYKEEQQQRQQQSNEQNHDDTTIALSGNESRKPETNRTSFASFCYEVVILSGGGHGPFFGGTAETYFDHILTFLCMPTT